MNIVLISLDAVRPDYLTSDVFQSIKEEGRVFDSCICQAPHTSTSHSSILTGLYPFNHGVRWLVDYEVRGKMIQECLADRGFKTAAFIGGFPLTEGNLDQGFEVFDYNPVVRDIMEGREAYMPANVVVQKAVSWLNENDGEDTFTFLHFFDAHLMLRSEFGKGEWPEKDENGIFVDVEQSLGRRQRRYKEEVNFMGEQIRLLLELSDVDLLVLTADHGTKMQGEKNYPWVYNSKGEKVGTQFHVAELYDQQLKVPLIFWGKDVKAGKVDKQVRSIDIAPTIMNYVGEPDYKCDGRNLVKEEYAEYAYSETYFAQLVESNRRAHELHEKSSWGWTDVDSFVSLRSDSHKLICTANGKLVPYELYDLKNDPGETENIIGSKPEIEGEAMRALADLTANDEQMELCGDKVVDDLVDKLETLGYL
ncbi:hypothetical protein BVX97_00880 [bacterium E08(2017)]|nr:hypothetical protein BVX97_00880 [bacterium E08(2017)]